MADKGKDKAAPNVVGGDCRYKVYRGYATIMSIEKRGNKRAVHYGAACECYEVRFSYHTDEKIAEAFAKVEGKEFTLLLTNGWYPGLRFLQKYGIEKGKVFDCDLHVIVKGTCTPVVFNFPAIALSDYRADDR